jgi:N-methylhydantoinase B
MLRKLEAGRRPAQDRRCRSLRPGGRQVGRDRGDEPFQVDRYELDAAPDAGAGRHRGGRGCIRDYRAVADEVFLTATFGRHKFVPWAAGGQEGSRNEVRIFHEDGREVVLGKCARYRLRRGEVARLVTGTGGGWGDPHERPVEEVVEDVKDGYVTADQAASAYGVNVDPETVEVLRVARQR